MSKETLTLLGRMQCRHGISRPGQSCKCSCKVCFFLADMTIVLTIEHFLEFILAPSPTTDLIDNGKKRHVTSSWSRRINYYTGAPREHEDTHEAARGSASEKKRMLAFTPLLIAL